MTLSKSSSNLILLCLAVFAGLMLTGKLANAQSGYTWEQIKSKFETANPTLQADEINVQEMKAGEITAYLRPNPLCRRMGLKSLAIREFGNQQPGLRCHPTLVISMSGSTS